MRISHSSKDSENQKKIEYTCVNEVLEADKAAREAVKNKYL